MASPGWVVPTEPLVELAVLPVVASVPVLVNVEAELVAADALPVAAVIPTGIAIKEKRAARMAATLAHRPLGRACKGRRARPRSRRGAQHLKRVPPMSAIRVPFLRRDGPRSQWRLRHRASLVRNMPLRLCRGFHGVFAPKFAS